MIISVSAFGQKNLPGYYSSNVPSLGFFVTRIQLNEDSTFKYEFSGDLAYNKGTGTYKVKDRKVVLLVFDTIDHSQLDSSRRFVAIIQSLGDGGRPKKLWFKNKRLYHTDSVGAMVKRGQAISRHKRFLLFGDKYLANRKIYLRKRPGSLVWRSVDKASR